MRSDDAKYVGVLSPDEYEAILEECRNGDYHNLHWLEEYFNREFVEDPEEDGTSWEELAAWRKAANANRSPE